MAEPLVSDELWARIQPILQEDWRPSPKGGQPPKDWRGMLNGIIHRLRSGRPFHESRYVREGPEG